MTCRQSRAILRGAAIGFFFLWFLPPALGRDNSSESSRSIILWVREVNGRVAYWVNDKPVGGAPLTGLETALGSNLDVTLMVVLDSRVPIREIGDVSGMLDKIPIKDARYYVYNADDPTDMWEIVWKPETLPVPASPPRTPKSSR